MSKIRVLIVEPGKEPYEARIENTLGTLQSIVDGYIEMIPMESGVDLIVNDEGKCLNLPFNRYITGNMLVGTIIVIGIKNGETISLSPELAEKYKKYFALNNHEHIVEYFKAAYGNSEKLARICVVGGY